MKNFLKALVLLFVIFILPVLIVDFCAKLEPCIRDYEEASLLRIGTIDTEEWGLRE